jgi:hypothetical protein
VLDQREKKEKNTSRSARLTVIVAIASAVQKKHYFIFGSDFMNRPLHLFIPGNKTLNGGLANRMACDVTEGLSESGSHFLHSFTFSKFLSVRFNARKDRDQTQRFSSICGLESVSVR